MKRPILCLDFDGVVHSYASGWKGARNIPDPPVAGALAFMANALVEGFDVVIHSSRGRHWGGISAMRSWLKHHAGNMYYDSPAGSGLERVRFARWKPSALVTLDDRALTFSGHWPALTSLRNFRPWNKRGDAAARRGYPIILGGDHAAFELAHADMPPEQRPDWPLPSFDAQDWAKAFCRIAKEQGHDIDEGWMVTWFANALMRGYDEHAAQVDGSAAA